MMQYRSDDLRQEFIDARDYVLARLSAGSLKATVMLEMDGDAIICAGERALDCNTLTIQHLQNGESEAWDETH